MKKQNDPRFSSVNDLHHIKLTITVSKSPYTSPKFFKAKDNGKVTVASGKQGM